VARRICSARLGRSLDGNTKGKLRQGGWDFAMKNSDFNHEKQGVNGDLNHETKGVNGDLNHETKGVNGDLNHET